MKHRLLLTALLLAPLTALHAVEPKLPALAGVAPIAITDMRTEGVSQPMGVEEGAPRFSWRYEAAPQAPRGFRQSACRIQVASSLEKLSQGQADMWDSGKQAGSDSLNILYAGKPLQSATRYFWQATGFDVAGKTYSSPPQYFETGLMKAEDWGGAQWIGARNERPRTIPANLQRLGDATFETRFRILDGSAVVLFQTTYAFGKDNKLEIQTGQPGKLIVTPFDSKNKVAASKEFTLPMNIATGTWHSLKVIRQGGQATFEIDGQKVATATPPNDAGKTGTLALGASAKPKHGVVHYDDFRLISGGETLVQERFDNPAVFAFQEYFYSGKYYSMVKDGVLEVRALNTYLDPKDGLAAPLFRKTFATEQKKIVRARAYVSGLGYYTFWLNGNRLDDFLLHPGFARYNKTAYYTVYDLTDHLAANNALAFELGRGWYAMTTPTLWGETFTGDWMAEPALRVLVTIDYADGSRQTVVSNPSFKTAAGSTLVDSVKAGEIYDARKELPGRNAVSFDDKNWSPAVVASGKMPSAAPGLTAQLFEPIRVVETVSPVSIEKVADETDAWVVDFGKHMAGTVELKVRAEAGHKIRMNHLESSVVRNGRERWNNFDAHATGSFQTDVYIAKGGGEETYQARYSYKGFRYVHIVGLKEKPRPDQVTAKVFNSDMASTGSFRSSSELWNKIWNAGRRSIQSNMHSIPTDCPQWEKLGWTCDDSSPFYAMAFNYDLRKLYEKRLQDFADDISPDGKIRNVVPSSWAKGEDPAWVGSYVAIAWKHYQTYGDRRVIERHYDNLKLYMSTLIKEGEASEKPPLLTKPRRALGDWVSPDGNIPPEGALIYYNLYFFQYARQMAEMAKVVGRAEDEKVYSTLAAALKKRFQEHHFDEKEGCYYSSNREAGFRQSPQAIALAFGLVPEDKVAGVVSRLVEDIQQRRKGHFWVGILGMEAIADALCENGRADVAYAAHLRDVGPSLGNMIREGATTIWEDYSITKARSLNHKMFATPLGWLARYVAGLHVDGVLGNGPGFREAVIAPYPSPAQMKFAQLDYDSPVGRYRSSWRMTDNGMTYDIVIPPNATAIFRLPFRGEKDATVSESGKILWQNGKPAGKADGIATPVREKDRIVFNLGSGIYSFQVKGLATAGGATGIIRELRPLSVRGVNYFPRQTPWGGMWTKTPPKVFEKDMALAASLGCNTVRTFVQFGPHIEQAGLLETDGSPTPTYLGKIETLLAAAWRHGIRLILCLEFNQKWLDARWRNGLTNVVNAYRNDGRVLMWDLMNEPDDDPKWTDATWAYLTAALPLIKQLDTNHFTTVGLAFRADRLKEVGLPDVMQYHEYAGKAVLLKEGPQRVLVTFSHQRKVGGARPLFIGEFGMSTARDEQHGVAPELRGKISAAPGTEAEQARLYEIVLAGVEQGHAAGALPWCLYDYPIKNPNESHFGLVRTDGTLKPAALVLRNVYSRWSHP